MKGVILVIDNNETIMYENGRDCGYEEGFDDCRSELMEVIESLAYEVAKHEYPEQYEYSKEQIKSIMLCAGLDKKYLGE